MGTHSTLATVLSQHNSYNGYDGSGLQHRKQQQGKQGFGCTSFAKQIDSKVNTRMYT